MSPMSAVDRLFDEYVTAYRAGEDPDPGPWLSRLDGVDRLELEALVDGYLASAPRQPWNPAAFAADQRAGALADELSGALLDRAGAWPALLPRLRRQSGLSLGELAARLAEVVGVAGRAPKVERYLEQAEAGELDPRGVSRRVLDALARLLRVSFEELATAADLGTGLPAPAARALYRAEDVDEQTARHLELAAEAIAAEAPEPWDEVDRLFRGGR